MLHASQSSNETLPREVALPLKATRNLWSIWVFLRRRTQDLRHCWRRERTSDFSSANPSITQNEFAHIARLLANVHIAPNCRDRRIEQIVRPILIIDVQQCIEVSADEVFLPTSLFELGLVHLVATVGCGNLYLRNNPVGHFVLERNHVGPLSGETR